MKKQPVAKDAMGFVVRNCKPRLAACEPTRPTKWPLLNTNPERKLNARTNDGDAPHNTLTH